MLAGLAMIAQVAQDAIGVLWPQQGEIDRENLPILYIKPLIASLEQVRSKLTPELLQNSQSFHSLATHNLGGSTYSFTDLLLTYLYHTEALIYSIALMQRESTSLYHRSSDFRRIEYLHHCLHAAKASIDNYLAFTPNQYAGMTMIIMMLFGQGMQFIYRLCVLEDPGWDRQLARETVDTVQCLEQAAQRLDAASYIAGSMGNRSVNKLFSKASSALRSSIPVWKTALEPQAQPPPAEVIGDFDMDQFAAGPALLDFSDVMWFEDTFPSWK